MNIVLKVLKRPKVLLGIFIVLGFIIQALSGK